jgi:hypothetical protein
MGGVLFYVRLSPEIKSVLVVNKYRCYAWGKLFLICFWCENQSPGKNMALFQRRVIFPTKIVSIVQSFFVCTSKQLFSLKKALIL